MLPHTPIHSQSLPSIFNPLSLLFLVHFNPFQLMLKPTLAMHILSHPFPVHIQILSANPIHHLSFQVIFSPSVLPIYVLCAPVYLCAFVFYVAMCLCYLFPCTLLSMPTYFTCLCVC